MECVGRKSRSLDTDCEMYVKIVLASLIIIGRWAII